MVLLSLRVFNLKNFTVGIFCHFCLVFLLEKYDGEEIIGSFCEYQSTDYVHVSLRRTKEIKDRKQNNSK